MIDDDKDKNKTIKSTSTQFKWEPFVLERKLLNSKRAPVLKLLSFVTLKFLYNILYFSFSAFIFFTMFFFILRVQGVETTFLWLKRGFGSGEIINQKRKEYFLVDSDNDVISPFVQYLAFIYRFCYCIVINRELYLGYGFEAEKSIIDIFKPMISELIRIFFATFLLLLISFLIGSVIGFLCSFYNIERPLYVLKTLDYLPFALKIYMAIYIFSPNPVDHFSLYFLVFVLNIIPFILFSHSFLETEKKKQYYQFMLVHGVSNYLVMQYVVRNYIAVSTNFLVRTFSGFFSLVLYLQRSIFTKTGTLATTFASAVGQRDYFIANFILLYLVLSSMLLNGIIEFITSFFNRDIAEKIYLNDNFTISIFEFINDL